MFFLNFIINFFPKFLIRNLLTVFFLKKKQREEHNYHIKVFRKLFLNQKLKSSEGILVANCLFGIKDNSLTVFFILLLKIFELAGFKIIFLSGYKFYDLLKAAKINTENNLYYYSDLRYFFLKNFHFKSLEEVKNFKWKGVECGKLALSSSFRKLKVGNLDFDNSHHLKILNYFIKKSIIFTEGANKLIDKKKIDAGLFIDKGYVGEGELIQVLSQRNKKIFNFFSFFKNNQIIIKNFTNCSYRKHPAELSDETWNKVKENALSQNSYNDMKKKIELAYKNNEWYPSAGTVLNKSFSNEKEIRQYLNFSNNNKIACIFSHIFWDGSFFFGEDLFENYEDWFIQTLISAKKNKDINWIVKFHPANIVKNNRENIKTNHLEQKIFNKYIKELPKNFRLLKEDIFFSSYNLNNIIDYCITVRGTPGIECAFSEKRVIVAGSGRYSHRGFTIEPNNIEEYTKLLENLPNENFNLNFDNAKKYFCHVYNNKPLNLNFIEQGYKKNFTADSYIKYNISNYDDFCNANDVKSMLNWIKSEREDYDNRLF